MQGEDKVQALPAWLGNDHTGNVRPGFATRS